MFKKIALALLIVGLLVQAWPAHAAEGPVTLGGGSLTGLALSPDGARLAVGSTIGLYFFDAQTFALTGFWPTPYGIQQVVWSPRGDVLALMNGNDIEIRQVESGAALWKHATTCRRDCLVTFSRDGSQVVVLRGESTASVYDLASGALVQTVHDEAFWSFSDWRLAHLATNAWQSSDGKLAFVGNWNSAGCWAILYDVPKRQALNKIALTYPNGAYRRERVALSPNGKLLAASEEYGRVSLWNVYDASAPLNSLTGYGDPAADYWWLGYTAGVGLHAFAWSPDSAVLYVGYNNTLDAWDAQTGQRLRRLGGLFTPAVSQVVWSADGRRIIAVQGNQMGDWDLSTRQPAQAAALAEYEAPEWRVNEMAASPKGDLVAVADYAGVTLHDAATLSPLRRIHVGRQVSVLAFSPDGRLLATGGAGPFVNVWEAATGRPVVDLPGSCHCFYVLALSFSPDGRRVYALESTGRLRQWDIATKATRWVQTFLPDDFYYDPAIHVTAGRVAAEMPRSRTIAVADLETGQPAFSVPAASPRSVIINAQGTRLAAIVGAEVKVWRLDAGQEVAAYAGQTGRIADIVFSPDGQHLASSSDDGTVKVWPVP